MRNQHRTTYLVCALFLSYNCPVYSYVFEICGAFYFQKQEIKIPVKMCYYISEYVIVYRMKFLNYFFQRVKTFYFIQDFCKIKVVRDLYKTHTLKISEKASCYA